MVPPPKLNSRKFLVTVIILLILVLFGLLTYLVLPESASAWGFLSLLATMATAVVGAYMGVNAYLQKTGKNQNAIM